MCVCVCSRQQHIVHWHVRAEGTVRGDIHQTHETEQLPSELYRARARRVHPVGQVGR